MIEVTLQRLTYLIRIIIIFPHEFFLFFIFFFIRSLFFVFPFLYFPLTEFFVAIEIEVLGTSTKLRYDFNVWRHERTQLSNKHDYFPGFLVWSTTRMAAVPLSDVIVKGNCPLLLAQLRKRSDNIVFELVLIVYDLYLTLVLCAFSEHHLD